MMNTAEELAERLASITAAGYDSANRVLAIAAAAHRTERNPITRHMIAKAIRSLHRAVTGHDAAPPLPVWPCVPSSVATTARESTQPLWSAAP